MDPCIMIGYKRNKKYCYSILKKELGKDLQEAIDNGYFALFDNSGEEPVYIFTQKGYDAAWGKE